MIDFEMRQHLMKHKKTSSQHSPPSKQAINKPIEKEGPVQEINLINPEPETKENLEILMLDENELDVRIEKLEKLLKKKEKEIKRKQKKEETAKKHNMSVTTPTPPLQATITTTKAVVHTIRLKKQLTSHDLEKSMFRNLRVDSYTDENEYVQYFEEDQEDLPNEEEDEDEDDERQRQNPSTLNWGRDTVDFSEIRNFEFLPSIPADPPVAGAGA